MRTTADTLHAAVICTLDSAAILVNCVLLYAIVTRTPTPMRSYSILLLNNALVDMLSASASMMGIARLVYLRDSTTQLYVYLGPCSQIGAWFCHLCQTVHAYLGCHSLLVLLHSFCFRLYILRDHLRDAIVPTSRVTALICLVLYAPTSLMMYFFYSTFERAPSELLRAMHVEDYATTWHRNLFDFRFVTALSYCTVQPPASLISIFFVRRRLLAQIRMTTSDSKKEHSNIARVLTYQLMLPIGNGIAISCWLVNVAGIWTGEAAERVVMIWHSLFALGSPLINLFFLPPYRRLFKRHRTTGAEGFTASSFAG